MRMNLADCFFDKAQQQPHHPLILGPAEENQTSYGEFAANIRTLAAALEEAGVRRGHNVGLLYPSGPDYIAFVYAVWTCGACATPLPIELTVAEKRQILQGIHIDGVISSTRLIDQIRDSVQTLHSPLTPQAVYTAVDSVREAPAELAEVNPAFIRFTSGTTGDAKGVVLSHDSVFERIQSANEVLHISKSDRIVWLLSMDYHFTVSIVAYLTFGASIIVPKNSFGVTLLKAATRHKATLIYGSPTHYTMMIQDDTGEKMPSELRLAIVTAAALRNEVATAFYTRFGRVLNETYGIIELGLPAINVSNQRDKQGSVGKLVPACELRFDRALDEEYGEITLRSPGMLDAYYSPWTPRETILQRNGGWFRTGDLGRLDRDGFLYIVGRVKEMISIGGMKVFPAEVEAVLESHPAVHSACVFGVQDRQWGEASVAHLVLNSGSLTPDDNALRTHCKQYLANHKIPNRFIWMESLFYTASGKKIRNAEKLLAC